MGGSAFGKTFGKLTTKVVDPFGISKPLRKIIDPLNIMDPLNVLPTSGEKWLTVDKNFAGGLFNAPKNQGTYTPMTKGISRDPQYFAQQQEMLNNMRQQQQAKLANLRTQGGIYSTTTSAPAQTAQASQSATTSPTTTALAQSQVGDTTAPSDMPTEYIYKPATSAAKSVAANTFQMPDMSSIKFGGA